MTTETAPTPPRLWRNRDFQLLVNGLGRGLDGRGGVGYPRPTRTNRL